MAKTEKPNYVKALDLFRLLNARDTARASHLAALANLNVDVLVEDRLYVALLEAQAELESFADELVNW